MADEKKTGTTITRARRRASKTRRHLLDAALLVFGDFGVESCTVENITERADLGKGTFYRHFEDKDALIHTLLEMAVDQISGRMPLPAKAESLEEAIGQIVRAHVSFYMDFTTTYAFLLQNQFMARSRRGIALPHDDALARYIDVVEARLAGTRPPGIDSRQIRVVACALAGWLAGFFAVGGLALKRDELAASADNLCRIALHGVVAALANPSPREAERQLA